MDSLIFDNVVLIPHKHGQLKDGVQDAHIYFKPVLNPSCEIVLLEEKDNLLDSLNNIYTNCLKYNKKSVFIGGDHSISISTIKAVYEPGMKIIWIDAHADINTIEESSSKNIHGMPLAFLTGLEKNIIDCSGCENVIVPFENIVYIGLRSVDNFEIGIIDKYNIKTINHKSYIKHIEQQLDEFIGNSKIHISFDVDALDPKYMPCTGTLEEDGITLNTLDSIFEYLLNFEINSMDIVEFNHKQYTTNNDLFTSNYTLLRLLRKFNIFKKLPESPKNTIL